MGSFFAGFNFARFIILACLVGSGPLAWRAWGQYEHNQFLASTLERGGEVESLVRRIQSNARLYSKLKLEQRDESLFGGEQADVHSYIRRQATDDNIDLGQVDITPRSIPSRIFTDHTHVIKPLDAKRDFSRTQLANFFYRLESESNRVKVTEVDIRNVSDKRLKDSEIPDDRWSFSATITTREKTEQ